MVVLQISALISVCCNFWFHFQGRQKGPKMESRASFIEFLNGFGWQKFWGFRKMWQGAFFYGFIERGRKIPARNYDNWGNLFLLGNKIALGNRLPKKVCCLNATVRLVQKIKFLKFVLNMCPELNSTQNTSHILFPLSNGTLECCY